MARKVVVELADDLGDGEATQTVEFALRGVSYEIDLSDKNAAKLEKALAPYVEAGRRIRGHSKKRATGNGSRSDAGAIRQWAQENGYEVSTRGRIPAQLVADYEAA